MPFDGQPVQAISNAGVSAPKRGSTHPTGQAREAVSGNEVSWVARPPRQGGRVAKRQEAAPCGFIGTTRLQFTTCAPVYVPVKLVAYDGASYRCATRPVLRTRPGHPVFQATSNAGASAPERGSTHPTGQAREAVSGNEVSSVARPPRQGGRVAKRQDAAPCGFIGTTRLQFTTCAPVYVPVKLVAYDGASYRCATRPVLRTRPGHPVFQATSNAGASAPERGSTHPTGQAR